MDTSDPNHLVARWRQGDQQAAAELFHRYRERLIALARSRLASSMAQRFDPEDVVQSAYRSFFTGTRDGRYDLAHGEDLWRLLVSITLHKLHDQVRRNRAAKRDVTQEQHLENGDSDFANAAPFLAQEPSPLEAVSLIDAVEHLMRSLSPLHRLMLELRLKGHTLVEIAAETQRSALTVSRVLDGVKQVLEGWQTEQFNSK